MLRQHALGEIEPLGQLRHLLSDLLQLRPVRITRFGELGTHVFDIRQSVLPANAIGDCFPDRRKPQGDARTAAEQEDDRKNALDIHQLANRRKALRLPRFGEHPLGEVEPLLHLSELTTQLIHLTAQLGDFHPGRSGS